MPYPDNFSQAAYDAKYSGIDCDEPTADEIERQIAIIAGDFTADFLSDMRDRFGRFDLPSAADLKDILIETLEDQMFHRLQAARRVWGEQS